MLNYRSYCFTLEIHFIYDQYWIMFGIHYLYSIPQYLNKSIPNLVQFYKIYLACSLKFWFIWTFCARALINLSLLIVHWEIPSRCPSILIQSFLYLFLVEEGSYDSYIDLHISHSCFQSIAIFLLCYKIVLHCTHLYW